MQHLEQLIATYWGQHGIVGLIAAWAVLSTVLNLVFSVMSPEALVEWAEKHPKAKAIVGVMRGAGIDPVAALKALKVYAEEKSKSAKKPEEPKAEEPEKEDSK